MTTGDDLPDQRKRLDDLPHLPSLNFIHPPGNGDAVRDYFTGFEKVYIALNGLFKIRERLEVKPRKLFLRLRTQVLLNDAVGILILEGQHTTAGVLND